MSPATSKRQINNAGATLRDAANGKPVSAAEHREALEIVRAFRAAHSYPLTHVRTGVAYHARKAALITGSGFDLSQRLKQMATITDKLTRMPGTQLARMQDVGGCRVTFRDQATVDAAIASIQQRVRRGTWDIISIVDYVEAIERDDGYRAKHVIVRKHGVRIEIQFRTSPQHNWAQLVEELDKALGLGLKQGRAPNWAVASVASAAQDMRQYELGTIDRDEMVAALNTSLRPILDLSTAGTVIR